MECAICIEEVQGATKLACGHAFHDECLFQSGKFSATSCPRCPLCRGEIDLCEKGVQAVARCKQTGIMMGDVKILKEAAALGSMPCGLLLASMYHSGRGVPQDDALAEHYWLKFDNNASACNNIGALAHRLGNLRKAERFYRKALEITPTANYHINLGILLCGTEESILHYYAAIEMCAGNFKQQAEIYLLMGKSLYKCGRAKEAYPHFRQCAELDPTNVKALNMAAITSGYPDDIHMLTAAVLALDANNADALCIKGRVYAMQHDRLGSDIMMQRLVRVAPNAQFTQELAGAIRREFGAPTRKRGRF